MQKMYKRRRTIVMILDGADILEYFKAPCKNHFTLNLNTVRNPSTVYFKYVLICMTFEQNIRGKENKTFEEGGMGCLITFWGDTKDTNVSSPMSVYEIRIKIYSSSRYARYQKLSSLQYLSYGNYFARTVFQPRPTLGVR